MFGHVDEHRFFPAEKEIAASSSDYYRQTEPHVVCHEDQHQQEAQGHLDDMQ